MTELSMNKIMQKTFSLENMETYFRDYIPCNQHLKEPITNFCTQKMCLKFLCPECIESHSQMHTNHTIESIKTCISKTSNRLKSTIRELFNQTNQHSFLKEGAEDYTQVVLKELEDVKKSIIDEVNAYFKEKEMEIKKESEKYSLLQNKIDFLKKEISQVIAELKMLDINLFATNESVNAIRKASFIDYKSMEEHFKSKIFQLQSEMQAKVRLQLDGSKKNLFRASLNELVEIRGKEVPKVRSIPTNERKQNVETTINDRKIKPNSLLYRISSENYFQGQPFLHFFECGVPNLHVVRINEIRQNKPVRWSVINLNINFSIPSFHKSVATQNGNIFMIGGTISTPDSSIVRSKSKTIYQCDPANKTLLKVGDLIDARSSHSVICLNKILYVIGGMDGSEENLKTCESFDPRTRSVRSLAPNKYPTRNSCVSNLGRDHIVKLGGSMPNGENSDYIEIYSVKENTWMSIDPVVNSQGQEFGMLSCSGWAALNDNEIFIFGGYNEQSDNDNSKMNFVLQRKSNKFAINHVNAKDLPTAGGFRSPQGIRHNGQIYALQNVDGEGSDQLDQERRTLLIFDGKNWSIRYAE